MIGGGRVTLSAVYITKLLILSKAQSAENNYKLNRRFGLYFQTLLVAPFL